MQAHHNRGCDYRPSRPASGVAEGVKEHEGGWQLDIDEHWRKNAWPEAEDWKPWQDSTYEFKITKVSVPGSRYQCPGCRTSFMKKPAEQDLLVTRVEQDFENGIGGHCVAAMLSAPYEQPLY
ncbi:hypothetical protein RvY_18930 [Ramazzottius varieornatus]|uniref:Uncharacterized protein n=1 Tax=Ramazzottius varieornatus TaxID=947166 RepID=A0A1D1W7M1_RAMVA|nr:hypothetical protein RvY_18930 [Ramazzottius varieornatus]